MSKRKSSIQRRVSTMIAAARKPISVIIPTRNEEKLLTRCLDQFPVETRQRFGLEVIVSDAGSTDHTIGIAAAYADKIAEHQDPNRRQTIAEGRNRGAAIAEGSIFVFLNADTQLADPVQFFERISVRFALDPSLAALAVKVEISPSERKWSDRIFHLYFNSYVHLLNILGIGAGRGESQIVRRSAFEAIKGYNNTFAAGEDFDLYHRISHFGKVKYDSRLLVYESPRRFRKHGYFHVYMSWIRNGFATFFSKKASSEVWEEVR
jgi:glycosyltransferase involved in cell wall biosynthesis